MILLKQESGASVVQTKEKTVINSISNDGEPDIDSGVPYMVDFEVIGTSAFLFHRWSCDAVAGKSKAAKGSKAKKTDNIESFVYRNAKGNLCIPGEYFRQAMIRQSKSSQDPRSPRKSAMDLFKAGVICLTELCDLGISDWDFVDRRRVIIQQSAITRSRPALNEGWTARCRIQVLIPEYVSPSMLSDVLAKSGILVGVGDFRPTFGRYRISEFKVVNLEG